MARIGIVGGSFNPIHLGHVRLACAAVREYALEHVFFVPCKVSPFKIGYEPERLVKDSDRIRMIALSIAGYQTFEISDIELSRGGVSYSVDTVKSIKTANPLAQLYFIIGSDALLTLSQWHKIDTLLNLCIFVTVERPGSEYTEGPVPGFSDEVSRRLRAHTMRGDFLDISSSAIRARIAAGESISGLVDPNVEKYIEEHRLYRK